MKILNICEDNPETKMVIGCKCAECTNKPAEIAIGVGHSWLTLCLDCTWNLMDWLQDTTAPDFLRIDR